jgi:predicted PurR-regulated permease PerM
LNGMLAAIVALSSVLVGVSVAGVIGICIAISQLADLKRMLDRSPPEEGDTWDYGEITDD